MRPDSESANIVYVNPRPFIPKISGIVKPGRSRCLAGQF
jgi:hypothetical protein